MKCAADFIGPNDPIIKLNTKDADGESKTLGIHKGPMQDFRVFQARREDFVFGFKNHT